ncbi:hypothetical protein [Hymenobacter mucosus]|uniref:Uncharacterized protein n=1 Tax=Hymenobacter mucosus TaxID=1411120 RepID=A0A238WWQ4_9BACT|nr:hypothetical protein [Hymenobacter mucosus]SNR50962.1 hypothetical protein SAMN06269173_103207 [Hymenobacter mucosus]
MIRTLLLVLALLGRAAGTVLAQGATPLPAATTARPTTAPTSELPSRPRERPKYPKPTTLDTNEVKLRIDPRRPIPAPTRPVPKPRAVSRQ